MTAARDALRAVEQARREATAPKVGEARSIEGPLSIGHDDAYIHLGPDDEEAMSCWLHELLLDGKRVRITVEVLP